MAEQERESSTVSEALASLSEQELAELIALSEDSSYVTPRVMSHLQE